MWGLRPRTPIHTPRRPAASPHRRAAGGASGELNVGTPLQCLPEVYIPLQTLTLGGPGGRQVLGSPFLGGRTFGRRTYGLRDKHFGGDNLQVPIFEGKFNNANKHYRACRISVVRPPTWQRWRHVANSAMSTLQLPGNPTSSESEGTRQRSTAYVLEAVFLRTTGAPLCDMP
jgi:hypothetical protein